MTSTSLPTSPNGAIASVPSASPGPTRTSTVVGEPKYSALVAALRRAPARHPWVAWGLLALGLVAAPLAGMAVHGGIARDAALHFGVLVRDYAEQVSGHIRAYGEVTYAVRAFVDARGELSRGDFHRFAQGLDIAERYPGITNVSYSFRVRDDMRPAFEQTQRAEGGDLLAGLPPFVITPPGHRAEYVVLSYIEPLQGNAGALGLDLATDPVRNAAVERARDSGMLSTTSGMTLLRDRSTRAISVLLRLPVYEGGGIPPSVEARRRTFAGLAGVAIRLPEAFATTLSAQARGAFRLRIEDTTDTGAQIAGEPDRNLLFDSAAVDGTVPPVAFAEFAIARQTRVGDKDWTVTLSPLEDPLLRGGEWLLPYAAAAAVLLATLLFFGLLRWLAAADARGQSLRRSLKTMEFHRARLAETQEIANIGGFEWDTRDRTQVWSDHLYRMLGRAVGDPAHPDPDFFFSKVVHQEDAGVARRGVRRVLAGGGEAVAMQCRIVRPDGAVRIVATVTRLEDADDGERTRVVGTVRDITDEWLAAERERSRVHFIQTMMDAIPIPVFQKDRDRRFRACNDAWCQFTGKPREQMIGRTIEEFLPGDHVEAIGLQDRRLLEHVGTESMETVLPNADGEPRTMMLHKASYPAEDGAIAGLVGVAFDITDMKETKGRLERTITELDRRTRLAELLGEFGEVLQACLGLDDAYEAISKYLPRLLPGSSGALYCVDGGPGYATRRGGWGTPAGVNDALTPDECVAVRRGQSRWVTESSSELNCRHFTAPPPAYACLPLSAHGELLGLLHGQNAQSAAPGRRDGQVTWPALKTAAEQISLALANLGIRETLREQATHDKLTGLYNRHYLHARFEQEIARARRHKSSAAIILIDIDHFKRINDTFGHAAGDHVLRGLGALLRGAGRKSDIPCRFGGEEFVLFMPDATCAVAKKRAHEILAAVRSLRLEWEDQALGVITVSAGISVFPGHGEEPEALMRAADLALYRAKELGRDRVAEATLGSPVAERLR